MARLLILGLLAGFPPDTPASGQESPSVSGQESPSASSQESPSEVGKEPVAERAASTDVAPATAGALRGAADLPWLASPDDRPRLPVRELGGPRELLEMYGLEESQIESLRDGQPLGPDDEETLVRILFRLPRFGLENVSRWSQPLGDARRLVEHPSEHRLQMFQLHGRVQRVERHPLLPEMAELYEFDHYYRVYLRLEDDPHPALVCAHRIPRQWPLDQPLDERVRVDALFLKVEAPTDSPPQLAFAADRIAWLPAEPRPDWGISQHQVLLAQLGMDVSLLDDVRQRNGRPIGKADRECFYQMLEASSRLTDEQAGTVQADVLDLAPLLLEPQTQQGRLISCRGTARRVTRIMINDPDIRQRFGLDHYYQLDVFLPLGEQTVRLGKAEQDAPVFTNSFPATFCVLELPEELQELADRMAAGQLETETLNEQLQFTGFYFKLWVYKSEFVDHQLAPMLLGRTARMVQVRTGRDVWIGLAAGVLFVVLLGAAWIGIWRYSRSDTRFERTTLKRQFEVQPNQSLNEMGIESREGPDFSNLD